MVKYLEGQQEFIVMKKSNRGLSTVRKIIIIVAAAVVVIGGTVAAKFYFDNQARYTVIKDVSGSEQQILITDIKAALDVPVFYSGISVGGVDVSGKTKEDARTILLEEIQKSAPKVNMTFQVGSKKYPLDPSAFSSENDLDTVLEAAFSYNRTTSPTDDINVLKARYEELSTLKNKKKDFPLSFKVGAEKIDEVVEDLLKPLETKPVDATVKGFDLLTLSFVYTDSSEGMSLDIDQAIKEARETIESQVLEKTIIVKTNKISPKVTKSQFEEKLGKISSFTTNTTTNSNRNTNIDNVCKAMDGLVLLPGESFDFNEFIGQRTAEKGYKEAPGIYNGTTRQELGGGICQTTGTLYHSLLMADLQIDERHPHSWPSDYVTTGTDATVTWGGPNFGFSNNTEYPIAIHCYYADYKVTMEVYGRLLKDGMTIDVVGVVTGSSDPGTPEYVADPTLPVGKTVSERLSHKYISALCFKVYYDKDGKEIKREQASSSIYPAIRAKIRVGVLAPDGTVCPMDPATGTVTVPTPTPPPETVPLNPSDPATPTPTPSDPTPTPSDPTPTPSDPTPTPSDPTPTPSDPTPTPSDPTPTPSDPTPTPSDPTPTPSDPTPTQSDPTSTPPEPSPET
jgi:vancomycin resistance protein YoaR